MTVIHPGQWRLQRIELLNWGTFHGHWSMPVARRGFLVTGPSGSGKSSLLDAVAAVLTPRGKVRFNAAAQDGRSSAEDRSLVSYLRGAWRRSTEAETGEVVSDYLRPEATYSGVLLSYSDGTDRPPVLLLKLYYLRRGAHRPADVQELCLILPHEATLTDFVEHLDRGIDVRKIKAAWPEATEITEKHSKFAARFSRLLGISGENAILLLHKTQSAKSLGSLDELFRSFMLDEPSTFAMAENAVAQFHELSQAHAAVVEARRQRDHLQQMRGPAETYEQDSVAAEQAEALHADVSAFKDAWKLQLARSAHEAAGERLLQAEQSARAADDEVRDRYEALQSARQLVDRTGGQAVQLHYERIELAEDRLEEVRGRRRRLAEKLRSVRVELPDSLAQLEELRRTAEQERQAFTAGEQDARARSLQLHDERAAARRDVESLEKDITALRRSSSNLDRRLLEARVMVAESAGLPVSALPFAGELLEVSAEFAGWTGAIERVLRPLATVMLVPRAHARAVRQAVDSLHLGARLVYEDVPPRPEAPRSTDPEVSLVHRVQVAEGPLSEWLTSRLTHQYDYACVESPAELAHHRRAVTRAGQVKRSESRYEKDDRSRVDDRRSWYLGFSTEAKLELLIDGLARQRRRLETAEHEVETFSARRDAARRRLEALEDLQDLDWADLDVEAAQSHVDTQRQRLETLLGGSTDLVRAQQAEREADARHRSALARQDGLRREVAEAGAEVTRLDRLIADLADRAAEAGVSAEHGELLKTRFTDRAQRRRMSHEIIDDVALSVSNDLAALQRTHAESAQRAAREFAAAAQEFRTAWPAPAADLQTDIEDRAGYLHLLDRLVTDGLPRFETRFFELLESQSQQNVAQLAAEIRQAVGQVRERIDPVNRSLARSVFDAGRYLRIQVKENRGELGRQFLADLQQIAAGSWMPEDRADAERRFETMHQLMRRLASSEPADVSWRRHCLDTRLHVRFTAVEVDVHGAVVNVHDTSAGLSGGQQQKLVTFCLAAALRYQLTRGDEDLPNYATVMMDEAFDKADSRFTRMAMDVFQEFGFHMVLATPLKLLQTLSGYIGGTAVIKCLDFKDSRIATVEYDDDAGATDRDVPEEPASEEPAPEERDRSVPADPADQPAALW